MHVGCTNDQWQMTNSKPPLRSAPYDKKVGLVLQSGAALGTYQAGVYEALASSDYLPEWVTGISIGADGFFIDRACSCHVKPHDLAGGFAIKRDCHGKLGSIRA